MAIWVKTAENRKKEVFTSSRQQEAYEQQAAARAVKKGVS
jgi:hypothetical protein